MILVSKKRHKLSASHRAVIGLILAAVTGYFSSQNQFIFAAVFMIALLIVERIGVTRKRNKKTEFLDVSRSYGELFVVLGLFTAFIPNVFGPTSLWLLLYIFGVVITPHHQKKLVLERTDRVILLLFGMILTLLSLVALSIVIILLAILANIAALQAIKRKSNI